MTWQTIAGCGIAGLAFLFFLACAAVGMMSRTTWNDRGTDDDD